MKYYVKLRLHIGPNAVDKRRIGLRIYMMSERMQIYLTPWDSLLLGCMFQKVECS